MSVVNKSYYLFIGIATNLKSYLGDVCHMPIAKHQKLSDSVPVSVEHGFNQRPRFIVLQQWLIYGNLFIFL